MSLRLAGEELSVVRGVDSQGHLREIEGNDADPGLMVDQLGSGTMLSLRNGGVARLSYSTGAFAFQEATTISTAAGDLGLNPAGLLNAQANLRIQKVDPQFVVDMTSGEITVSLDEGGAFRYRWRYSATGNQLRLESTDVDGVGTNGDIWRVSDGGNRVVFLGGVGFFGTTPPVSRQVYAPTNVTADRAFDADTVALAELADVVGTLIADLKTFGIIA